MTLDLAKLRAETLALLDGTTPGPWEIMPAERWGDRVTEYYHEVWDGDYNIIAEEVTRAHRDGGRKNIRLIAAAPTLAADKLRLLDEIEARDAEIERLRAALADARAALKPFSDATQWIDPEHADDYSPSWAEFFAVGDFRKAATALSPAPIKGDDA